MKKQHGSYRMSEDVVATVKQQAKKERRTFNNMLEVLVVRGLKQEK